jgi:hypothetical protein
MKRQHADAAANTNHLYDVLAAKQGELTRRRQTQVELEADRLARNQDLAMLTSIAKGI